jgi:hypothetical protein
MIHQTNVIAISSNEKDSQGSCFILDTIIAFVSLAEKINEKWINISAS